MRWTALLAFLLLAGCLEPGPGAEASGETPGEEGRTSRIASDDGVQAYDGSFDLVLNPDDELLLPTMVVGNTNCILFSDGETPDYQLLGGKATMTWDATTPLAEELVLVAYGFTGAVRVLGSSPLSLDLTGLEVEADGSGIAFMADHEIPQVPVQQAATLQVTFDYEGDLPTPLKGFCTNGL